LTLSYFIKKILILLLSLFLVITGTFFLMKIIPGDPFIQDKIVPQEVMEAIHKYYGLDKPLWIQYLKYLKGFVTADLGPSLIYQGRTVNQIIREGFPVSAAVGIQALLLSLFFGTFLGSIAAAKQQKWQNNAAMIFTTIGISIPNFVMASLLQYIFCMKLNLLPIARWGSYGHTVLPTIALACMPTAFIARLIRANMVEVLKQDYIKTAYAKGLKLPKVILKHALRNAILPVISYLGPITTYLLTGSFVIEKIFGIPGLGQWLVLSISNRDYPVILGLTVFYSTLLLTIIFLVDILYTFIDPRVQISQRREDERTEFAF